jgi:hypothetical protein
MSHYYLATLQYKDPPGFIEVDGQRMHVDTAASRPLLEDYDGADTTLLHPESEGVKGVANWRLVRSRRSLRVNNARYGRAPLARCAHPVLGRDPITSSGTVLGVVTAAEISLRAVNKLAPDQVLSVSALEEFATVLGARAAVSTIYTVGAIARQVGFLLERDVDGLANRFLGSPGEWQEKRHRLSSLVFLNKKNFDFDPDRVRDWLETDRPVIARVDPRKLVDVKSKEPLIGKRQISENTHHTVTIIEHHEGFFTVRTGWRQRPVMAMPVDAPSEGWGVLLYGEDEDELAA